MIVSGHRRKAAALRLGLDRLPVLARDMSDDEAAILMVDSNIQRENLLPSEKAFAYKMRLEALKRQAGRPRKDKLVQVGQDFSRTALSKQIGESESQIQRYIRMTNLAKPILDMADAQHIAFSPAVDTMLAHRHGGVSAEDIQSIKTFHAELRELIFAVKYGNSLIGEEAEIFRDVR